MVRTRDRRAKRMLRGVASPLIALIETTGGALATTWTRARRTGHGDEGSRNPAPGQSRRDDAESSKLNPVAINCRSAVLNRPTSVLR